MRTQQLFRIEFMMLIALIFSVIGFGVWEKQAGEHGLITFILLLCVVLWNDAKHVVSRKRTRKNDADNRMKYDLPLSSLNCVLTEEMHKAIDDKPNRKLQQNDKVLKENSELRKENKELKTKYNDITTDKPMNWTSTDSEFTIVNNDTEGAPIKGCAGTVLGAIDIILNTTNEQKSAKIMSCPLAPKMKSKWTITKKLRDTNEEEVMKNYHGEPQVKSGTIIIENVWIHKDDDERPELLKFISITYNEGKWTSYYIKNDTNRS